MVLKVRQPDTGRWFYYDKICLFKFGLEVREMNAPVGPDEVVLLPAGRDAERVVAVCVLNFEDGQMRIVVCEDSCYLLNDAGQTIERIV